MDTSFQSQHFPQSFPFFVLSTSTPYIIKFKPWSLLTFRNHHESSLKPLISFEIYRSRQISCTDVNLAFILHHSHTFALLEREVSPKITHATDHRLLIRWMKRLEAFVVVETWVPQIHDDVGRIAVFGLRAENRASHWTITHPPECITNLFAVVQVL